MKPKMILAALLGLSLAMPQQGLASKWTDLTGKYEVDAEFVKLKDGVRVWDAKTGRELIRFNGHKAYVSGVAFAPDGKHLASTAMDGTVRLWELP